MTKCAELLNDSIDIDFIDINVGCPIDVVYSKVRKLSLSTCILFVWNFDISLFDLDKLGHLANPEQHLKKKIRNSLFHNPLHTRGVDYESVSDTCVAQQ